MLDNARPSKQQASLLYDLAAVTLVWHKANFSSNVLWLSPAHIPKAASHWGFPVHGSHCS